MNKWKEDYIEANGLKIHYYRTGGDKPQVILNHDAGDDGLCWTHLVKELEKEYDLIMPDARGHGKSASGRGNYSSELRAADLAGLVQALELDRPVVGGHSMGADTCLYFAALYPDLTRGIIMEDPPIFTPGEQLSFGENTINMEDIGKMMAKFMRMYKIMPKFIGLRMAKKASPTYPDDEIIPWINSKKRVSFDFLNSMTSMRIVLRDPFEVFQKIGVPILLLIGDREKGSIVSQAAAQKAAEINPGVKIIHLGGASHDIRRTRFDGYLPALQDFLADIYHP